MTTPPLACSGSLQELEGREGKGKGRQQQQHGSYFWGSRLLGPEKFDMELFTRGAGVIFEWLAFVFAATVRCHFWSPSTFFLLESLFLFFFTISHHDSLVYVMREICWRRRSYWETGEKKQLSRVLITLRTVAGRKFWRRRSALVSGRWYYCKNVTSGLLAEESQRRRRRRKIADQLANVGRQIGKDFATCNKNREVLLTNCCNISPKNCRKSLCPRERAISSFLIGGRKTHFAIVNEEV